MYLSTPLLQSCYPPYTLWLLQPSAASWCTLAPCSVGSPRYSTLQTGTLLGRIWEMHSAALVDNRQSSYEEVSIVLICKKWKNLVVFILVWSLFWLFVFKIYSSKSILMTLEKVKVISLRRCQKVSWFWKVIQFY